jgi:hypothetical protein
MNSITKEFEHFSRKVIEHARGSNGGFETGMQACWCRGQNFVPFAPQTTAHLLLRRFAFFLESPFCPWMPRDASCYGPTSRRQPTRRGSCSDSTKNLQLVQYVIAAAAAAVLCIITPLVSTLDCSVGIPVDEKSCAPI